MLKRTTIYMDSKLHQAVKVKAAETNTSISDIMNEAARLALKEDAIDLQSIKDRTHEPSRSYEAVLKDLKRDGLL